MAFLYITEIDLLGIDSAGNTIMSGVYPTLATPYSVTITGASIQSQLFSSSSRFLELHCDAACSIAIGTNPVAVTTAGRLGAGERIFYPLRPGIAGLRLAVIANT